MKKISALEVFTKAFYFTFSSFDLIFLIFLITGIASAISLSILHFYPSRMIEIVDEISPISVPPGGRDIVLTNNFLILSIGIIIFLFLVSVLCMTIAYLYVFSKRGRKVDLLKIIYNVKDYYVGMLILSLINFSIFIILKIPSLIPFYGNHVSVILAIISFFILLAIALYIHLRLSLSLPIYLERKNVIESLKESWKLMKGNVIKLFLILVLILLISLGFIFVGILVSLPFYFLANVFIRDVATLIVSSFFTSIIAVLVTSAYTFFYFKLKGKK